MQAVGIIAEYNPFHNGHAYQLRKAKEISGCEFAVVVMSPDFVQRGEPAIVDKYRRTELALRNGADLVLELPVCYACASAEYFAEGAVALLDQLGCVSHLAFGCETPDAEFFDQLAKLLLQEPESYRKLLRQLQKDGLTYPEAREKALIGQLPAQEQAAAAALLSSPNNILALEYTKALKKSNHLIRPLPLLRIGSGYHSLELDRTGFCSASAIRRQLSDLENASLPEHAENRDALNHLRSLEGFLPSGCLAALETDFSTGRLVFADDFSSLLHYQLLSTEDYTRFLDVNDDLSRRIKRLLPEYQTFSSFVELVNTRQLTQARIRRSLLHILLGITDEQTESFRQSGACFYARVLGFRREATPLLHQIKTDASIPLISKLANAKNILGSNALSMLRQDIYASHLYQLPQSSRLGKPIRSEYTCSPLVLS